MPLKGFDEMQKELSAIGEMTKFKFSSKEEAKQKFQEIMRKHGISSKRALELWKNVKEK